MTCKDCKHWTPTRNPLTGYILRSEPGVCACPVTWPDARLIECAPELLEALRRLDARGWFKESTCADQGTSQDMAFARAVLAKAKGQQGGAA